MKISPVVLAAVMAMGSVAAVAATTTAKIEYRKVEAKVTEAQKRELQTKLDAALEKARKAGKEVSIDLAKDFASKFRAKENMDKALVLIGRIESAKSQRQADLNVALLDLMYTELTVADKSNSLNTTANQQVVSQIDLAKIDKGFGQLIEAAARETGNGNSSSGDAVNILTAVVQYAKDEVTKGREPMDAIVEGVIKAREKFNLGNKSREEIIALVKECLLG
jgi:hypothetical protein